MHMIAMETQKQGGYFVQGCVLLSHADCTAVEGLSSDQLLPLIGDQ